MTPDFFERQIERLKPLGEASDQFKDEYWTALKDIPPDVFEAAVSHALRTRMWFPKPVELRHDADTVKAQVRTAVAVEDRSEPLAAPVTIGQTPAGTPVVQKRIWRYYCEKCSDSGMVSWWCGPHGPTWKPWYEDAKCERYGEHAPHEWVAKCACFESNPALQRKREQSQKFADQKATK